MSFVNLLEIVYPVGAIYTSTNSTPPPELFDFGEWSQIKDTFLLTAGDTYKAGDTGGEATHKLTVSEMPSHTHAASEAFYSHSYSGSSTAANRTTWASEVGSSISTKSTGGSAAHNNMPPYRVVYAWERTA